MPTWPYLTALYALLILGIVAFLRGADERRQSRS